jgi:hypothetical protein
VGSSFRDCQSLSLGGSFTLFNAYKLSRYTDSHIKIVSTRETQQYSWTVYLGWNPLIKTLRISSMTKAARSWRGPLVRDGKVDWPGSVHNMATYLLSRMHKDLLSKENIEMWYTASSEVYDEHLIMGSPDAECAEARGASPAKGQRHHRSGRCASCRIVSQAVKSSNNSDRTMPTCVRTS